MAFSPLDIFDLLVLRASAIAGNDGDAVALWEDESAGNRDVAEVTSGQNPLLKKGANGINGKNVVRFDGVDNVLMRASTGIIQNISATTFYMVIKPANTSQNGTAPLFISKDLAGFTRFGVFMGQADGKLNAGGRRLDANSSQFIAGGNLSTNAQLVLVTVDYANATLTIYENGTQTAQSTSFQTAGSTSNTASTEMCVGANASDGGGPYAGDIAEIGGMLGIVSEANRNLLGGYIQTEYGITVAGATGVTTAVVTLRARRTRR